MYKILMVGVGGNIGSYLSKRMDDNYELTVVSKNCRSGIKKMYN